MRRYNELSEEEQAKAIEVCTNELLEVILGGGRFVDEQNGDDLQQRVDKAIAQADKMQTPWFAGEYIMESCGSEIRSMASTSVEDAFFPDYGDLVIDIR